MVVASKCCCPQDDIFSDDCSSLWQLVNLIDPTTTWFWRRPEYSGGWRWGVMTDDSPRKKPWDWIRNPNYQKSNSTSNFCTSIPKTEIQPQVKNWGSRCVGYSHFSVIPTMATSHQEQVVSRFASLLGTKRSKEVLSSTLRAADTGEAALRELVLCFSKTVDNLT